MKRAFPATLFVLLAGLMLRCEPVDLGNAGPPGKDPSKEDTTSYSCAGKTRCGEMKSCKEAEYYLRHCLNVEIDGDGDGIPCEEQWCG